MKTINLPSAILTVHDSPYTLPESRRVEHDYYAMIDANVGSTIDDFDTRLDLNQLLIGGDADARTTAFDNLRFLFYNLTNRQTSPRALAFACLIETVDGVAWGDYSESGVEQLVRLLSGNGLSDEFVLQHWPELRRKIRSELAEQFPAQFPDNEAERLTLMQESMILQIDEYLEPDDEQLSNRRERLRYETQQMNRPTQLSGPGNALDGLRSSYLDNRIAMELEGLNVDDTTPSVKYWQYIITLNKRYKTKPRGTQPTE